jgi:hypothetical protein
MIPNATFTAYNWAMGIWETLEAIKPFHIPDPAKSIRSGRRT